MWQNNVSSIAYRTYEPTSQHIQSFPSAAIEIESALRSDGHLVTYDSSGKRIWYFRIQETDSTEGEPSQTLDRTLKVAEHTLSSTEEGSFQPNSIQKGRSKAPTTANTPLSASSTDNTRNQAQASPSSSQPGIQEVDMNAPSSSAPEPSAPLSPKTAYEHFVTAVLLSTSVAFCHGTGLIPLNYRTVLLSPKLPKLEDGSDTVHSQHPLLGTFSTYLTTMGSLILNFKVSPCPALLSIDNVFSTSFISPGQSIWAAPFGVQAVNASNIFADFGTASLAQTPTTQALSFRGVTDANEGAWKHACLGALQLRGISPSSLEGCHWVNIGVPRNRLRDSNTEARRIRDSAALATISWPGPLCFRQRPFEASASGRLGNSILNGHEESHDPLGNARQWLYSAKEREDQLLRRQADRTAVGAMDIDSTGPQAPPPSALTPAAFTRPGTGIASAMYPTPPDGFQPPSAITPSFDGATSSPQNAASAAVPVHGEDTIPELANPDNSMFGSEGPKRDRSSSNNILGDSDGMMLEGEVFEDNDITEADFNFFDEEQPEDLEMDLTSFRPSAHESPQQQDATQRDLVETPAATETPPSSRPGHDSTVFMKPELKHARSQLSEAVNMPKEPPRPYTKRGSSPFTKEDVFKRICGPGQRHSIEMPPPRRRNSEFDAIPLSPMLPLINKKYQKGGTFSFDVETTEEAQPTVAPKQIPETNYLRRHSKSNRKTKGLQYSTRPQIRKIAGLEAPQSHPSPFRAIALPSEHEDSSGVSDEDDSSFTTNEELSPVKSSFKRGQLEDDVASQGTSFRETEVDEEPDQQLAIEIPRLSKPEPPEAQLSRLFLDPEPLSSPAVMTEDETVDVAQALVDQAATGTLVITDGPGGQDTLAVAKSRRQSLFTNVREALATLHKFMPPALRGVGQSRLKGLLEVADVPLQGQPSRLQPRPVPGREGTAESMRPANLYQIPSHRVEVRRADSKLSLLPTAISFWETMGLAPAHGAKDIQALCVFPGWHGMIDNVKIFMNRLKGMYELLKLGTFEQLPLVGDVEPGLVPFEIDRMSTSPDASVTGQGSAVIESMETMMPNAILAAKATEVNFVVFMVYSPNNPGSIVEACSAFQRYYSTYWKPFLKRENLYRDLILQLVSVDMISSPSAMVITSQSDVVKLCLETYDRCTLFGTPEPTPAIMLEQALPRIIDFKPTTTPSASLIHENSCIHVAYAQSVDERWVTAAWTDDRGSKQTTAAYCLGRKGRPLAISMQEVAHEIWENTLEIIAHLKVHWRVIITKSGPMDTKEINFWSDLAKTESNRASIALILMTVSTTPDLQILPPDVQVSPSSAGFYTTPVSTPQANVVSPEQSYVPGTPNQASIAGDTTGDADPEGALLDLAEQTWGAVVGHRLNNSSTPLELQPALVSGYLIKRTGATLEDPPVVMEINLVHTENTQRAYEPLLREMLSTFRGLGTLARARGVTEREADVRPWHIAAVEKATRALYLLM